MNSREGFVVGLYETVDGSMEDRVVDPSNDDAESQIAELKDMEVNPLTEAAPQICPMEQC